MPAGELIDGQTIARLRPGNVDYVHLELDRHDIVLAESLSADSWLDTGTRTEFEGGTVLTMHPTFAAMAHDMACRHFVIAGPEVEAAQAALVARDDA